MRVKQFEESNMKCSQKCFFIVQKLFNDRETHSGANAVAAHQVSSHWDIK